MRKILLALMASFTWLVSGIASARAPSGQPLFVAADGPSSSSDAAAFAVEGANSDTRGFQEVIGTAQHRAESAQHAAMAIDAVSGSAFVRTIENDRLLSAAPFLAGASLNWGGVS